MPSSDPNPNPNPQTTISNGSSAISLSSPSPIKHKPQYSSQQNISYDGEGGCVSCCVAFFYLIGMVLIVLGIGATAMITQYPEHVLYLAMVGASGIILGLIFVSLSATMCRPRRGRVVDTKSDVNGNAGNQTNGKSSRTNGVPSTNRYEVRAGSSGDVIEGDNLVLSSSPKMHPYAAHQPTALVHRAAQPQQKHMPPPIQLKFAGKNAPSSISDFTISAHHSYGTLPPAYMTLSSNGHMPHQYPADISAHSLVNNYSIDASGVSSAAMMVHPSGDEGSTLKNIRTSSTATLPLPARMRSSVSYNDILLEEPRRVGIHILRKREAASNDALDSGVQNGAQETQLDGHHHEQSSSPTPPSESNNDNAANTFAQKVTLQTFKIGQLAPMMEGKHHSTSSDERSSPRSDYYSKESSIGSNNIDKFNTVGLPQVSPRRLQKPPEVAPKPFIIPNVANLRPVLPQLVTQPSYGYGGVPGHAYHPDASYASIDHSHQHQGHIVHSHVHSANVVALHNPEDISDPSRDLLETQI